MSVNVRVYIGQQRTRARTSLTSILALITGLACRSDRAVRQHGMEDKQLPVRPSDRDATASRRVYSSVRENVEGQSMKTREETAADLPHRGLRRGCSCSLRLLFDARPIVCRSRVRFRRTSWIV